MQFNILSFVIILLNSKKFIIFSILNLQIIQASEKQKNDFELKIEQSFKEIATKEFNLIDNNVLSYTIEKHNDIVSLRSECFDTYKILVNYYSQHSAYHVLKFEIKNPEIFWIKCRDTNEIIRTFFCNFKEYNNYDKQILHFEYDSFILTLSFATDIDFYANTFFNPKENQSEEIYSFNHQFFGDDNGINQKFCYLICGDFDQTLLYILAAELKKSGTLYEKHKIMNNEFIMLGIANAEFDHLEFQNTIIAHQKRLPEQRNLIDKHSYTLYKKNEEHYFIHESYYLGDRSRSKEIFNFICDQNRENLIPVIQTNEGDDFLFIEVNTLFYALVVIKKNKNFGCFFEEKIANKKYKTLYSFELFNKFYEKKILSCHILYFSDNEHLGINTYGEYFLQSRYGEFISIGGGLLDHLNNIFDMTMKMRSDMRNNMEKINLALFLRNMGNIINCIPLLRSYETQYALNLVEYTQEFKTLFYNNSIISRVFFVNDGNLFIDSFYKMLTNITGHREIKLYLAREITDLGSEKEAVEKNNHLSCIFGMNVPYLCSEINDFLWIKPSEPIDTTVENKNMQNLIKITFTENEEYLIMIKNRGFSKKEELDTIMFDNIYQKYKPLFKEKIDKIKNNEDFKKITINYFHIFTMEITNILKHNKYFIMKSLENGTFENEFFGIIGFNRLCTLILMKLPKITDKDTELINSLPKNLRENKEIVYSTPKLQLDNMEAYKKINFDLVKILNLLKDSLMEAHKININHDVKVNELIKVILIGRSDQLSKRNNKKMLEALEKAEEFNKIK